MIVEERLNKDNQGISRRLNELGLKLKDVILFDWSPMFALFLYDEADVGKANAEKNSNPMPGRLPNVGGDLSKKQ